MSFSFQDTFLLSKSSVVKTSPNGFGKCFFLTGEPRLCIRYHANTSRQSQRDLINKLGDKISEAAGYHHTSSVKR